MEREKIYREITQLTSVDIFYRDTKTEESAISDEHFLKMQSLIPDCIAHEMSHPDHNVHLGSKKEFYCHFDDFLKRLQSF